MTIYILDDDQKKIAGYLDDKSLDKMIKDIAQVLCNVHYLQAIYTPLSHDRKLSDLTKHIPLSLKNNEEGLSASNDKWSKWAHECVANYNYFVELGLVCCDEWELRFTYEYGKPSKKHKSWKVLLWYRENVPDLPTKCRCRTSPVCMSNECDEYETEFPLVMPKKYFIKGQVIIQGIDINSKDNKNPYKTLVTLNGYNAVESYRNYYQAKLKMHFKKYHCAEREMTWAWTKREKPEWINL